MGCLPLPHHAPCCPQCLPSWASWDHWKQGKDSHFPSAHSSQCGTAAGAGPPHRRGARDLQHQPESDNARKFAEGAEQCFPACCTGSSSGGSTLYSAISMSSIFQNFHRQNPAATQGRCSIYPAIHDLLLNLSLPNEGPTFHGPPGGQGIPGPMMS